MSKFVAYFTYPPTPLLSSKKEEGYDEKDISIHVIYINNFKFSFQLITII